MSEEVSATRPSLSLVREREARRDRVVVKEALRGSHSVPENSEVTQIDRSFRNRSDIAPLTALPGTISGRGQE